MSSNPPYSRPASAPDVKWRFVSQSEVYGPDETGRSVDGIKVAFTLENGQAGTVFLPRSRFSKINVDAAIRDYAHRINEVAQGNS